MTCICSMKFPCMEAIVFLVLIPLCFAQGLSTDCYTPEFAKPNATGQAPLLSLYYAGTPDIDASNLSTAVLATANTITQHYWINYPKIPDGYYNYIADGDYHTFSGACLILLDGFIGNSLKGPKNPDDVYDSCNHVLSRSCHSAIVEQARRALFKLVGDETATEKCSHVLKVPPAECNGTEAWSTAHGINYGYNPTLFSGSPTCGEVNPFNGTAERGWLLQRSMPISKTNNLKTWSSQASVVVTANYFISERGKNGSYGEITCVTPNNRLNYGGDTDTEGRANAANTLSAFGWTAAVFGAFAGSMLF